MKNVLILLAPSEIDASSIEIGICISLAVAERIVYGILLITKLIIIIAIVPVNLHGFPPNAITSIIPITEPGIIYGNIENVSIVLLSVFDLLTTR